ncbi:AAA family ATPase [Paractinoplanes lichenicola]|uniref:ATP-binding protein n=1 Tax=Paractinoplanes lichenicola TaxID=2802976 RepID=A0ABS1W1H7_9ACTN|nr:AAA family ATPase [Actinoplanes lichenicola]MBL7260591.1 ATP-binding protein [Actinoplanes lichenicola]
MNAEQVLSPAAEAGLVVEAVLRDLREGDHRGVVVDSPPGAGKSTLVVRAAGELAAAGEPLMIVAQTNEQVDDLIARLGARSPEVAVGRLSAVDYEASERVRNHPNCRVGAKVAELGTPAVTIGTAAKWATVSEGSWPWAIVDEAYQMRSDALLRVAPRFVRALFVGDPGQLDPFSTVDVERWTGLSWDPMQSAVAVLLRHNPDLPVHRLPVSWRLPHTAAPVVAEAFYPFTGFRSGTGPGDRHLVFGRPSRDRLDDVLDAAAATGWGLHELPARFTIRTDAEAAAACAELAARALAREGVATSESGAGPLTPGGIAIGAAHRDQAATIRSLLPPEAKGVTVDTANRLQGREYDLTIVLHPLSGRQDATAFHLESGRLCVLTSRHRHACVVVAREGIAELLDAHPSTEPVHLNVPVKFPDGWEANQAILAYLHKGVSLTRH